MNGMRIRLLIQFSASMVLILVFSSMNIYTLILAATGGAMMLLAFFSYYRVGAVFGFLLVSVCAGASADVPTLTEVGPLLTATVGLVIPIIGLGLFALSCEIDEDRRSSQKSAALTAGIYAFACLASAPISVSLVGLIMPSLSSRLPGLLEMAFVLLVASVGATIMIGRDERLD